MNKLRFYIFGVPDGFNLFEGDADDTSYYQLFYDGSKENTKLSINRKTNGQVSYSYLRYKLVSVEGRPGAFLGMSIIFDNEYCRDTSKLYRLFESVYKEIILKNKVLLAETKGNVNSQAKFLVRNFKQQEDEVRNIESIILKNIENKFQEDTYPIDSTFNMGKPNLIRKINSNQSNYSIIEALRNYSWVSISDEYPEVTVDEISEEGIKDYKKTSVEIKDKIIKNYNELVKDNLSVVNKNISGLDTDIQNNLQSIRNYLTNQPQLESLEKKYEEIESQLNDLKNALKKNIINKPTSSKNKRISEMKNRQTVSAPLEQLTNESKKDLENQIKLQNNADENGKNSKPNDDYNALSNSRTSFDKNNINKSIFYLILVVLVALILMVLWSSSHKKKDCPDCLPYYDNFETFLSQNRFEKAWLQLKKLQAEDQDISDQQQKLVERVKSKVETLEANKTLADLQAAFEILQQSEEYNKEDAQAEERHILQLQQELTQQTNPKEENPSSNFEEPVVINKHEHTPAIKKTTAQKTKPTTTEVTQTPKSDKITLHIFKCEQDCSTKKATDAQTKFYVNDKIQIVARQGNSEIKEDAWQISDDDLKIIKITNKGNPMELVLTKSGSISLTYKDQSCTISFGRK